MISHRTGLMIERRHKERIVQEAKQKKAKEEAKLKEEATLYLSSDLMPMLEIEEACAVLGSEHFPRLESLAAWGGKIQEIKYAVDLAELPKVKLGGLYAILETVPSHRRKINNML